jgi:hypothetical protein
MTRKKASVSILLPLAVAGLAFGIWRKRRNGRLHQQNQLNYRLDLPNAERERMNIG